MSAALKSYVTRPTPSHLRRASAPSGSLHPYAEGRLLRSELQARHNPLRPLPLSAQPSRLLVTLSRLQWVSSVLATVLVGSSLVGYGTSVYIDRQLNRATKQLSQLQRNEQQLTTANAILISHIAQQAERPETGLQPPKPDSVIFLKPAPARSKPALAVESFLRGPDTTPPLGY